MNFETIDIKQLIPQQEPFVMVENLLFCDEITTRTSLTAKSDNIFVSDGVLLQAGVLENVAQTCAARLGYLTIDKPVRIGFIGAINDFEFTGYLPKVNEKIFTEIKVTAEIGNIILIDAKVECNSEVIAFGTMKVALME